MVHNYFASPWMLFALIGVLIPILLHLWKRRPKREIEWGAMRFLELALQSRHQSARLDQWLLLLIRCLTLGCLGLAVAQPFRPTANGLLQATETDPPQLLLLVVDDSYSTLAPHPNTYRSLPIESPTEASERSSAKTILDRIGQLTLDRLNSLHAQDAVALVRMSSTSTVAPITFDRVAITRTLQEIQASERTPSTPAWTDCVERTIQQGLQRAPQIQRVEVAILSDMASNTWDENTIQRLLTLQQNTTIPVQISLVPLATQPYDSLWIEDLNLDGAAILGSTSTLRAHLNGVLPKDRTPTPTPSPQNAPNQNTPNQNTPDPAVQPTVEVAWLINQDVIASYAVRVDRLPMVVEQEWQPQQEGPQRIECRISLYPQSTMDLPTDNQHHLIVTAKPATRLLAIERTPEAAKYVKAAFEVGPTPIEIKTIPSRPLRSQDLAPFDALYFSEADLFDATSAQNIYAFVERGGICILSCGPGMKPNELMQALQSATQAPSWPPFRFGETMTSDSLAIDPLNYASRLVAPFRDFPESGLLSTPISRYWKAQVDHPDVTIDLALANQDPLIFHHEVGQGLMYWIMTPLSLPPSSTGGKPIDEASPSDDREPWNAMAAWPSFVPLMQGMLNELASRRAKGKTITVGQSMGGSLPLITPSTSPRSLAQAEPNEQLAIPSSEPSDASHNHVTLTTPSHLKKLRGLDRASPPHWFLEQTEEQGFYHVQHDKSGYAEWFAVNIDTQESRQSYMDPSLFPQSWLKPTATSTSSIVTSKDQTISRWLLGATFMGLVAETGYLVWLSRGRRS